MKKIILLISVCLIMLAFSSCTDKDSKVVVEIPDANFKAFVLENYDTNKDGELSLSEAKKVKDMDCSGKEIKKLDGIEKFSNLESLNCSNNQLDEMTLTDNKKLNKLICKGNHNPLWLYIGMNSPLRNMNVQKPANNVPPQQSNIVKPWDESKVICDENTLNVSLSFEK